MATVIQSNMQYVGTRVLPNIIDNITDTATMTEYLKKILATVGGDVSYVTDANSDAIFNTLKAHRARVIADGGRVLSIANTLKAIIFATQNSLTSSDYSAYAPDFGLKMNGSTVVKMYDISGRDMRVLVGVFERSADLGYNVIKNLNSGTLIAESSINGAQGLILGSSLHDGDAGGSTTQTVRGMYLSDNAGATGTGVGSLETNNGGISRLYYKRASDGVLDNLPYDQTANYKKYSGLVGYMSNSNTRAEIYENNALKAGSTAAQIDLSGTNIFPVISMPALNSMFRESWLIRSTSQPLAIALSNYLNKSS